MTGYGTGTAQIGRGMLVIEARAGNHRFLDVQVRFPPEIMDHASASDAVVRRLVERGRIEITARVQGVLGGDVVVDLDRARAAFRALMVLRDELSPGESVPLSLLASVPDLFALSGTPGREELRSAVERATEQACLALGEMRIAEGAALAADMKKRLEHLLALIDQIGARCPRSVLAYRNKLLSRIRKLLEDSEISPDPGRLEHEIALFADRSDVSEELTRLRSHCEQLNAIIAPGHEPTGRRMEFLLQEMVREANTIGSKVSDLEITRPVVELKAELERMREQVHNIV